MAAAAILNGRHLEKNITRMAISLQRVIRFTSCLVLALSFRGRRIERRYLRFEQIQDGGHRHGHRHVGKISSGDITATGRPIHFMFCSRVGFSGTEDLMALFPVQTNPRWRPPPSWNNFEWPYLRNGSRSTYIAVIFAIAQLSCLFLVTCARLSGRHHPL